MMEKNNFWAFNPLFEPQSVAVVGASYNPEKIGHKIFKNIISGGFKGKVIPVNPKGGNLLGHKVFPSILQVNKPVDVAIISIPANFVFQATEECGQAKVKFLIVISSGFSEIGNKKEEEKLIAICKKYQMRLLGPNVFGMYSAKTRLNATFSKTKINSGNLAVISQSGALAIAMIAKTQAEGLGLSHLISLGNEADIETNEILEYLKYDTQTKSILIYLEGIKNGLKLFRLINKTSIKKPIIIIKAGKTTIGARAASSHTGALAVEDRVFNDLVVQAGALRVETIRQAFSCCRLLLSAPKTKGNNCLIITNGGGFGVLACDAAEKYGLKLYNQKDLLYKFFQKKIVKFGSFSNPIDLSGQANKDNYLQAIKISLQNNLGDSLLCLGCETAKLSAREFSFIVKKFKNYQKKPIVFCFLGEPLNQKLRVYDEIYNSVEALAFFHAYSQKIKRQENNFQPKVNLEQIKNLINNAQKNNRFHLSFQETEYFAANISLKTPKSFLVKTLKEALKAAKKIGYPIVLKAISNQIIHKTEFGAVITNIYNSQDLKLGFTKINLNCRQNAPQAKIEGILVCQTINKGINLIIGAKNHEIFGPVVMVGIGGIYVEVFKDISFRSYPLSYKEILRMIKETKAYPLLLGNRNLPKKDIKTLVSLIATIGEIVLNIPEIKEIEINPLMVFDEGEGVTALDIRVIIENKLDKN